MPWQGQPHSLLLTVPPLAVVFFKPDREALVDNGRAVVMAWRALWPKFSALAFVLEIKPGSQPSAVAAGYGAVTRGAGNMPDLRGVAVVRDSEREICRPALLGAAMANVRGLRVRAGKARSGFPIRHT